jgi:hypothetical protein
MPFSGISKHLGSESATRAALILKRGILYHDGPIKSAFPFDDNSKTLRPTQKHCTIFSLPYLPPKIHKQFRNHQTFNQDFAKEGKGSIYE